MIDAGLLGRKSGAGFYLHEGKETACNPRRIRTTAREPRDPALGCDLQQRMVLLMVNEAARCLEEEVVAGPRRTSISDGDGHGFAPFRGGPLLTRMLRGLELWSTRWILARAAGGPFRAMRAAADMAASGKKFYMANWKLNCRATRASPRGTRFAHRHFQDVRGPARRPRTDGGRPRSRPAEPALPAACSWAVHLRAPSVSAAERRRPRPGDAFLKKLEAFLRDKVDPDEIDRTGEIPAQVIDELAKHGRVRH